MKPLLSFIFCLFIGLSSYAQNDVTIANVSNISSDVAKCKIYPNPCYGDFNIQVHTDNPSGDVDLYVLNILGQPVYHEKVMSDKDGNIQKEIVVNTLPTGLYFVKLNDAYTKHDIVKLRID